MLCRFIGPTRPGHLGQCLAKAVGRKRGWRVATTPFGGWALAGGLWPEGKVVPYIVMGKDNYTDFHGRNPKIPECPASST
jgi:hypothetical protein